MQNAFIGPDITEMFGQLILAVLLGAAVGIERELARKTAGMRTYALVAMGSALFSMLSKFAFPEYAGLQGFDPSRIASQILVGIGFIGAGIIIFNQQEERVRGLTTAASIWAVAAIGMAIGFGQQLLAVFATMLVLIILIIFWWIEEHLVKPVSMRKKDL